MRGKRLLGLLLLCIFCSSCALDSGNVSLDTEGTEHSIAETEALNAEFEKMDRNKSLNVAYELRFYEDFVRGEITDTEKKLVEDDLGEKFPDIPREYYKVLEQYEDILKEEYLNLNDCMEKFYVGGEWEYVNMELYVAGWDDGIYYSLYDLTGDGFPELLMGWMDSVETVYWPYVMYTVGDGETIENYTFGAMPTVVCDNGAIITYGHVEYVMIMQFQADTGQWRYVDVWSEDNVNVWSEERPKDTKRYYSREFEGEYTLEKGEQKEEISQMDYNRIIDQYKTTSVMLEWALFH